MTKKSSGLAQKARHDPRTAALLALSATLDPEILADSQAALEKVLSSNELMPSDKGLCTELVYGCLRNYLRLDWFLRRLLPKPEGLPPEMFRALLLTAYEIAHLRSPDYAAVNWAVAHVRNRFGQGLSRVANGVLRAFQKAVHIQDGNCADLEKKCDLPDYFNYAFYERALGDPLAAKAVFYAVPEWLVDFWQQAYGPEATLNYLKAGVAPPMAGARINAARPDWKMLMHNLLQEESGVAVGQSAVALPAGQRANLNALHRQGRLSRQSAAVHEALFALKPQDWPLPIWDACAGRGGKTMSLLEHNIPVALASDPAAARLNALPGEFARLGLAPELMPQLMNSRAQEAQPILQGKKFGTVLVDAPCSGLGTLARRPEIRLRRTLADLDALIAVQDSILDSAWQSLAPGGKVVYLTCTLNPKENEGRIAAFLARHPEARQELVWSTAPESPLGEYFFGAILA